MFGARRLSVSTTWFYGSVECRRRRRRRDAWVQNHLTKFEWIVWASPQSIILDKGRKQAVDAIYLLAQWVPAFVPFHEIIEEHNLNLCFVQEPKRNLKENFMQKGS